MSHLFPRGVFSENRPRRRKKEEEEEEEEEEDWSR